MGMWDPPGPGVRPVSPALAGECFSTEPPGKPQRAVLSAHRGKHVTAATEAQCSPPTPWQRESQTFSGRATESLTARQLLLVQKQPQTAHKGMSVPVLEKTYGH